MVDDDLRDKVVLLVEPDRQVRRLTHKILTEQGCEVHEAESQGQALEILAERQLSVDLLILEVVLPDLIGLHLARSLREARPNLPVIFISSYFDEVLARSWLLGSNWDFLQKPFSLETLTVKVKAVLSSD
jgi:DNA-binding response OmpR family regulator